MRLQVFSVYDAKTEAYLPPFFTRTQGEAVRMFTNACISDDHAFATNPYDFALFYIGTYNDEDGSFSSQPPLVIAKGYEIVNAQKDEI